MLGQVLVMSVSELLADADSNIGKSPYWTCSGSMIFPINSKYRQPSETTPRFGSAR